MKPRRVRCSGGGGFVTCPFCKYSGVHLSNPCAWCAGCHVRYRVSKSGLTVLFDPGMRARSFGEALAMAMSKAGGVRLGTVKL